MISAAISRAWKDEGFTKRSDGVARDYLGSEDRRTKTIIPKFTLNELNDSVFQKVVVNGHAFKPAERKRQERSNVLLIDAYHLVTRSLKEWLARFSDHESALLDLEDFMVSKVQMIVIDVGDSSDAFVIFETLNDRGLELAISDLVKNYLFSKAGMQIEKFKLIWAEIGVLVGGENLTAFLRHYWLSAEGMVRERDLYRVLRKKATNRATARQLLDRLREVADLYSALSNPEHAFWADFDAEARNHLEALMLFKVTQFRPVALAVMDAYDAKNITKALRLLKVISFRYTVVSGLGTGNLERYYTDAALAVRSKTAKSPQQLFSYLRPAYVSDERFQQDFADKSFTKASVARYILSEINDAEESDTERMVAESTGRITLEHILPKKPGKEWKEVTSKIEDMRTYVDRIGNLTLLEKGRNRGLANSDFKTKRTNAYSKSSLQINQGLAKLSTWDDRQIEERCKRLAISAAKIWRVNY